MFFEHFYSHQNRVNYIWNDSKWFSIHEPLGGFHQRCCNLRSPADVPCIKKNPQRVDAKVVRAVHRLIFRSHTNHLVVLRFFQCDATITKYGKVDSDSESTVCLPSSFSLSYHLSSPISSLPFFLFPSFLYSRLSISSTARTSDITIERAS